MSDRRLIRLVSSGGTIATRQAGAAPELTARELTDLARRIGVSSTVELEAEEVALRPSWSLALDEMDSIARAAVDAARQTGVSGVVVTHGTTTLEYTAYLTDLRHDGEPPIVFTGAMRRADAPAPDGPGNLRDAITVAADPRAAGLGALVAFAGRILSARETWKRHRTGIDALLGLEGGVGEVVDGEVRIRRRPRRPGVHGAPLEPRVALLKAYPGAGRGALDALLGEGARGLVVEGLPGLGGVPEPMQVGLRDAARRGVPIVLASRAPFGEIPPEASGGTGDPLADIGLISAGALTAEKAWILLAVALGQTSSTQELRRIFATTAQQSHGEEEHG